MNQLRPQKPLQVICTSCRKATPLTKESLVVRHHTLTNEFPPLILISSKMVQVSEFDEFILVCPHCHNEKRTHFSCEALEQNIQSITDQEIQWRPRGDDEVKLGQRRFTRLRDEHYQSFDRAQEIFRNLCSSE